MLITVKKDDITVLSKEVDMDKPPEPDERDRILDLLEGYSDCDLVSVATVFKEGTKVASMYNDEFLTDEDEDPTVEMVITIK